MLEAAYADLVSPSARSAAPNFFSYPQADRPITPSNGMARPCSCPARRKVLRGIKKRKEHVPCHTNPHPSPSARSASISVRIASILSVSINCNLQNQRLCAQRRACQCKMQATPRRDGTNQNGRMHPHPVCAAMTEACVRCTHKSTLAGAGYVS
jgi:hypothetical protein